MKKLKTYVLSLLYDTAVGYYFLGVLLGAAGVAYIFKNNNLSGQLLYFAVTFIVYDFIFYLVHRAAHYVPLHVHKIHHANPKVHFSLIFPIWDIVLGTIDRSDA